MWAATTWGIWPIGTVVLLVVLLTAAVSLLVQTQHRAPATTPEEPNERAHVHDQRIVREVRELVTRDNVSWLREWDFGGSWRDEWAEPFMRLDHLDDVEHRPLHSELSAALRGLLDANAAFTLALAQNSFRERNDHYEKWWNVGWSGGEAEGLVGQQRKVWEQRRKILNDASTSVVEAYDAFVDVARRKLLL